MIEKLFIVGVGRSGTSLLQSMLNAHSKIQFLPETGFLRRYIFNNTINCRKVNSRILKADTRLNRLDIDLSKVFSKSTYNRAQLLEKYSEILSFYANKSEISVIGDKDPRLIEFIHRINKIFSECYIIHIVRDPRDIIRSKLNAEWSRSRSIYIHIFIGLAQLIIARTSGSVYNERFLTIRYEDMVSNPSIELTKLCNKIGIDFESEMLSFNMSASQLMSADEYQWKKETLSPLKKDNFGKWKHELSAFQVGLIESVYKDVFIEYGYRRSLPYNPFSMRVAIRVASVIYRVLAGAYCYGRYVCQ